MDIVIFVIFIDDYSCFVWLFPFKRKSKVFQTFDTLQKLVERQFYSKIKIFQFDFGGEYEALVPLFKAIGIDCCRACSHLHEHNGMF